MTVPRTLPGALLALALTLTTASALGAPPDAAAGAPSDEAVARAVARFEQGQKLYAERDFAGALTEFRKAYEIAPNYRLLYNIGQVCYQMQDYVCARRSRERYLASGAGSISEARRQAVVLELAELEKRIGYIEIETDVAGAEISVDDVLVGTSPLAAPVAVSAGRHRTTVLAAGRPSLTRSVDVAGRDTVRVAVVLAHAEAGGEPAPAASPPPPAAGHHAPASGRDAPEPRSAMTPYAWLGYGTGGLLAAGATVTGVLALSAASDVRSTLYDDDAAAASARTRASTLAIATDALVVGAVLTLAATTVLTFVLPRRATRNVGVTAGPRGFDGRLTF